MEKLCDAKTCYKQVGAFKVHKSALMALTGWRPYYWKTLTFKARNKIDASTLSLFLSNLKAYSHKDVETYHEAHRQWLIYNNVANAQSHFWRRCIWEHKEREHAIREQKRAPCGARKKTGKQCKAKAEIDSNRCRFHGGNSTGPKTIDGKIKSLSKLTQYRRQPDLLVAKRQSLIQEMRIETGF